MKNPFLFKALSLFTLSFALSGCYEDTWSNWFKTEEVTPMIKAAPNSASQLLTAVSQASQAGKRIRMTGNGHSISDVAITNEVLLTPEALNKPLNVDSRRLKANDASLVRVQSGIKIADLNSFLDSKGRALLNMGGYDGQTLARIMMKATHGSGLAYGPVADAVVSLQMVVDGGKMVQIEPRNGITNPATFSGRLEEDSNISVQLIQDDDAFNAARVSIGSMGVVYAITLKTDQKFWLREVRHLVKWSELKKQGGLLERALNRQAIYGDDKPSPEHWELQYSPYADDKGDHTFLITDRYRSYSPLPEQASTERGQVGADFGSALLTVVGAPAAGILDLFPALAKPLLETALSSQVDDNYTNVSYKVFNIGVVNHTPVYATETAFRLDQVVPMIERSFAINDALFAKGIPHTAPIAIRFVKQSDGLIAMQQGRDTGFMEIIVLRDGKNAKTLLQNHIYTYRQAFNTRPHWGLDLNSITSDSQARALYPDTWDRWKNQYRRFNVSGTFDGKVTDRLGISVRPR
ncbi:MAG: FAD-binding protein [Pseudomonadales bacterium]|nr:FAD-binding protein [Pseudomonadales bacterium]